MRYRIFFLLILFLTNCKEPVVVPVHYYQIENGLAEARKTHKPVLVYYSAYSDVLSRKLEDQVFTDPEINSLLQSFVIIRLMIDERGGLTDSMKTESGMENIGEWYEELMQDDINSNYTPAFCIYDTAGFRFPSLKALDYKGANDKASLQQFLEDGITAFASGNVVLGESLRWKSLPGKKTGAELSKFTVDTSLADITTGISTDQKIKWEYKITRINDEEAMLEMHGIAQGKLRFFAYNQSSDEAPKSKILFSKSSACSADGMPLEMKIKTIYDQELQIQISFVEGETTVKQKIKLNGEAPYLIHGINHFFYGDSEWISAGYSEFRFLLK